MTLADGLYIPDDALKLMFGVVELENVSDGVNALFNCVEVSVINDIIIYLNWDINYK